MDLLKALISGPVDSPYAHGLYLFDIGLPEDYPNSPPVMKIQTTGGGTARFNPNLYADGYI
jgi:baculoviral IAP repeat-containing protein 6